MPAPGSAPPGISACVTHLNRSGLSQSGQAGKLPFSKAIRTGRRSTWPANVFIGWRGLAWFWAIILGIGMTGAAILQIAGPPLTNSGTSPSHRTGSSEQALPGNRLAGAQRLASVAPFVEETRSTNDSAQQPLAPRDTVPNLSHTEAPAVERAAPDRERAQAPRLTDDPQKTLTPNARSSGDTSVPATAAQPAPELWLSIHCSASSGPEAQRLAQKVGSRFDHTEIRSETRLPMTALVRFSLPSDHAAARAVGKALADMGYTWRIENLSARAPASPSRVIEVWMPFR